MKQLAIGLHYIQYDAWDKDPTKGACPTDRVRSCHFAPNTKIICKYIPCRFLRPREGRARLPFQVRIIDHCHSPLCKRGLLTISSYAGFRSCIGSRANRALSVQRRVYQPTDTIDNWDKLSVEEIEAWEETGPATPLLDTVNYPVHMKNFSSEQLRQLCKELRSDIVHKVSKTGGHLSSSLGVVELTVAMHHVFNSPEDKFIWDVGHQAYGHKILTGRRSRMHTIRTTGGLSGGRGIVRPHNRAISDLARSHALKASLSAMSPSTTHLGLGTAPPPSLLHWAWLLPVTLRARRTMW